MSKLIKLLAGLLLVTAAAVVALPLLINPNDYRDEIAAHLAAATGRELRIDGELRLSLFPRIRISASDARIPSPPRFSGEPLMRAALIELHPRLLPLLQRRLEIGRLRVEGLRVHLLRAADGSGNWGDVAPAALAAGVIAPALPGRFIVPSPAGAAATTTEPKNPATAPPPTSAPTAAVSLRLEAVELVDAALVWDDQLSGRRTTFEGIGVEAGPVSPGTPMVLSVDARSGDLVPAAETRLSGRARISVGPELTRVQGMEVRLDLSGKPLGEGRILAEFLSDALIDPASGTVRLSELRVRSGALTLSGELAAEGLNAAPAYSGRLALAELDLRAWLAESGFPVPATADPETLRRVALTLQWRLTREHLVGEAIELTIDQTQVRGKAERLPGPTPTYRFALNADALDLDRYRPGVAASAAATAIRSPIPTRSLSAGPAARTGVPLVEARAVLPASLTSASTQAAPAPALALPALAGINLDGRLEVGALRLARLAFGDADLRLSGREGRLRVDNRVEHFYQGRLEGRIGANLRGTVPELTLVQRAEGVSAGPLMTDLLGSPRISGRGEARADLSARGTSREALLRSLAGHVSLALRDGQVQGLDLERLIRAAQARPEAASGAEEAAEGMAFSELTASAVIDQGILRNEDLLATSDYLRVTGRGRIDLGGERLDYLFEPVFVRPPQGRGIKELEGVPIPTRLTGSFDRPEWRVDLAAALRAAGQRRLEEQIGKDDGGLKRLEEGTGIKGLEQGLRRLFGH